jgi:hypothetical protein
MGLGTYDFQPRRGMGLTSSKAGSILDSGTYLKRKYRWTFAVSFLNNTCPNLSDYGYIPECYVKSANRPKLEIEELELNYLNQKFWVPGKGSWQALEVTYYDIAVKDVGLTPLWTWIDTIYQFMNRPDDGSPNNGNAVINRYQASRPGEYTGWGFVTMYDGCGVWVENWNVPDMWPQNIDLGELDYSSNDEANIVVTYRYSQAYVQFNTDCTNAPDPGCCSPCSST